jgi:hypothetical protein
MGIVHIISTLLLKLHAMVYYILNMLIVTIVLYIIVLFTKFYKEGGSYSPKREVCKGSSSFCNITTGIDVSVPSDIKQKLIQLSLVPDNGKRVEVIGWKAGRTIPCGEVCKIPGFEDFHRQVSNKVSQAIGEKVIPTDYNLPTSASVLVYEKKNDFINWHYDVNYYKGRFFTMIIPLTREATCTNFKYRLDDNEYTVKHGDVVLFEGEKLFHMASKLCDDQFRAVLSLQFVTTNDIDMLKFSFLRMKDEFAYTGVSSNIVLQWIIRIIHMCIYLCFAFYVLFYTSPKYDALYLLLFAFVPLSWMVFKGESILGYWEKKLISPHYVLGQAPFEHIFVDLLHHKLILFLNIMVMINLIVIVLRNMVVNMVVQILLCALIIMASYVNQKRTV